MNREKLFEMAVHAYIASTKSPFGAGASETEATKEGVQKIVKNYKALRSAWSAVGGSVDGLSMR